MRYDKLAMGSEHRKHIAILSVVVVILFAVVLYAQSGPTGSATATSHDIEITQVALAHTAADGTTDAMLTVAADIINKRSVADTLSVYLHVDGVQKDVRTDQVFYPEATKTITMDWPLSEGTHSVKVAVGGEEFETAIKVIQVDGEYTVTEVSVGTTGIPAEHKLDFSEGGVEYDVDVRDGDVLELTYGEQVYPLNITSVTADFVELGGKQISISADAVFDLDEDGLDDITVRVNGISAPMGAGTVGDGVASLTIKSKYGLPIWRILLNFWWLILIVVVLVIAFFLMRKTEILRTKHGRGVLEKMKEAKRSGVISESLYHKARRAVKKKLKP